MTDYRIFETKIFDEDVASLRPGLRDKIRKKLREYVYPALRKQPRFGPNIKKLRDWDPETWRYRIGAWRIFYEIEERERLVFVLAFHRRSGAYRRRR